MRILVRVSAFLGLWVVFYALTTAAAPQQLGADIGLGLLLFACAMLTAGFWALLDGLVLGYGRLALLWGIVAGAMLLVLPTFAAAVATPEVSAGRVFATALVQIGPVAAVLVLVPALVGGAIGTAVRGRRGTRHRAQRSRESADTPTRPGAVEVSHI